MKAIVYYQYGSPEVLRCEAIEKPAAGDDEVLIKLCAASVNPLDWHFMRGKRLLVRLMAAGLLRPKHKILGCAIAGRVEAVGKNVKQFQAGDEVFAGRIDWRGNQPTCRSNLQQPYPWRHSPPCRAFATRGRSSLATKF